MIGEGKEFMSRYHKYFLILFCMSLCLIPLSADDVRDEQHQPDKVMDLVGVKPGMIIGEVGAGHGYFTFKLSQRVGESGKIYANDISRSALRYLRDRCKREDITNVETILGDVEDPLLPKDLDMVFIVNAFHDLANPVELLNNLSLSLKSDAHVVILDRDPEKVNHATAHFLSREEVLEKIEESVFELERLETFLPQHNIYIIRKKDGSWSNTEHMKETFNFFETEYCPMLSPDVKHLFFTSRKSGNRDIYWVDAISIQNLR